MQVISTGKWEIINPSKAKEYLANRATNRKVVEGDVHKYAQDMSANKWERNPQPIMFDTDGKLIDGQHRMLAVVESNTEQLFYVMRNVDTSVMLSVDSGRSRNDADALKIAGMTEATSHRIGVLRRVLTGMIHTRKSYPRNMIESYMRKWLNNIMFAEEGMPKSYRQAALLAPIVRADLCGVPRERLTAFKSPFVEDADVCHDDSLQPAFKLKNWLDSGKLTTLGKGNLELYRVATKALKHFLDGEQMDKKRGVEEEIFATQELSLAAMYNHEYKPRDTEYFLNQGLSVG